MTHIDPTTRIRQIVLTTSSAWLLTACAGVPAPKEQMAVAEASVQRASTVNTSQDAPAQLQLAVGKLEAARAAMLVSDHVRARQLAEQADLDAQVADLHAQSVRAARASKESQDAERALREEAGRKTQR